MGLPSMTTANRGLLPLGQDIVSYVRVSILGTFASEEVWSVNPVFDPNAEFGTGVDQAALDTAALNIANIGVPTSLRLALSTSGIRTGCRLEVRDDGDDSLLATSLQASATPQAGTATVLLPPQSAVVFSIRTNTPGGSGRGRIYWPAMGCQITSTGRLNLPLNATLATDFRSYTNSIRSALATAFPTIGFDLAVRSKTTHTTPHAVRVQVGNIIDTQRRRRDNLPESYAQVSIPT